MHEKPETSRFYRMRLPHWEVAGGRYFVTIRLKGSIPEEGLRRIRYYLKLAESAIELGCTGHEERKRALAEMERCLHAAPRVAHLANRQVADRVTEAIRHREKEGVWTVFSYVIMPNHIHLFFRLGPQDRRPVNRAEGRSSRGLDERASPIVPGLCMGDEQRVPSQAHRASDYSGPQQSLYLDRVIVEFKRWTASQAAKVLGVSGESFWQREWFDHWSRSAEEDRAIEEYIRRNPLHIGR